MSKSPSQDIDPPHHLTLNYSTYYYLIVPRRIDYWNLNYSELFFYYYSHLIISAFVLQLIARVIRFDFPILLPRIQQQQKKASSHRQTEHRVGTFALLFHYLVGIVGIVYSIQYLYSRYSIQYILLYYVPIPTYIVQLGILQQYLLQCSKQCLLAMFLSVSTLVSQKYFFPPTKFA